MKRSDDSSFAKYMAIYMVVGALSLTMQRLLLLVVVPVGVGGAIYYYRRAQKNTNMFYCWICLLMGIFFIGLFLMIFEVIPFLAGAYLSLLPFSIVALMFGSRFWQDDPINARITVGTGVLFLAILGALTVMFW